MKTKTKSSRPAARRGFTLIELLIAGLVTAFVLGSVSMTLANLGHSKSVSNQRLAAYLRADTALNALRRDIASIVRADDLFYTRFLLMDGETRIRGEMVERDELVMFCNRLRPLRDIDFHGEGLEYETQYRIEDDEFGPALWMRRDPLPDEYPLGGGVAEPVADGIVSLRIEAYDGEGWNNEWESDEQGLPLAVRVTIVAAGQNPRDDLDDIPYAVIRTVIPIDRILLPKETFLAEEQALIEEMEAAAQEAAVQNALDQLDRQEQESQSPGGTGPDGAGPGQDRPPDENADPAQTLGGGRGGGR